MLFHETSFLLFFAIVFGVYWFALGRSLVGQNLFLVIASYVFYGWWSAPYVALIVLSSLVDYTIGLVLDRTGGPGKRRLLLATSLSTLR